MEELVDTQQGLWDLKQDINFLSYFEILSKYLSLRFF